MKVGISAQIQFSLFSGGAGGVSLALADCFKNLGHEVWIVNTHGENQWWDDCSTLKSAMEKSVVNLRQVVQGQFPGDGKKFDLFIEVDKPCFHKKEDRLNSSQQSVWLLRKSPIFHDIEASLFPFDSTVRCLEGLTSAWLFDLTCTEDDKKYIECLARCPVHFVPFIWTPIIAESHRKEMNAPEWFQVTEALGKDNPWKVHICETNNSSTSSLTIPLVILKDIKKRGGFPVKEWVSHNSDHVNRSDFFKNNVKAHCEIQDLSGSFAGRQRIVDWVFDPKSCILSHMRFSQIRPSILDAVWTGIPLVHNCLWLKNLSGSGYDELYYPDNEIVAGGQALVKLNEQWTTRSGIFSIDVRNKTRHEILSRVSPFSVQLCDRYKDILSKLTPGSIPSSVPAPGKRTVATKTLNVVFTDMWDDFNADYNMFTLMMNEAGRHLETPIRVRGRTLDDIGNDPIHLCMFGPFGQRWTSLAAHIPKVHYTGENSQVLTGDGVKLNIGYQHADFKDQDYLRIPLWMLEIDWFGCDKQRIVNPKPLPIDRCTKVYKEEMETRKKFCAFVVTNPCNPIRNSSFLWLSKYKHVDSAGRLFNNIGDAIFAGRGGGGGELKKFEFLKDYKFCLAYENSSSQGYRTEKFLHAKAAGCIPIYWGDPKVERDFDKAGFIDAREIKSEEQLIEAVRKVDEDPALYEKMFSVPALDETRRDLVRRVLSECSRRLLKLATGSEEGLDKIPRFLGATNDAEAAQLAELREMELAEPMTPRIVPKPPLVKESNHKETIRSIVLLSYATKKFLPSLHQWAVSIQVQRNDPSVSIEANVWLGTDVDISTEAELTKNFTWIHFHRLPTDLVVEGFPDIWAAEHYAWKLWILNTVVNQESMKGKLVLYLDSGVFMCRWPQDWMHIANEKGLCMLEDPRETNNKWCHDVFCSRLAVSESELAHNQVWAGAIAFVGGHSVAKECFKEAWAWGKIREVIVGAKWEGFRDGQPFGHRHDQSILSIITARKGVTRYPLDLLYCDESLRRTFMTKKAFYVHRGAFSVHKEFLKNIDDCYVINLDRRKDRLDKLLATSPELNNRMQRVPAVDGKTLQLTPAIARLFRPHDFNWKKPVMGCALSHLGVWWQLANERDDINAYLILEDDVKFSPDWEKRWKEAADSLPEGWDVIYFGGILPPNRAAFETVKEKVNTYFSRVGDNTIFGQNPPNRYFHWCNYSYVLSKQGARKVLEVLKHKDGFWTSGDHMVCNLVGLLNMYFLDPLASGCYQDDDPTYKDSAFNDFNRVDKFDSDLWNNNDRFNAADADALAKMDIPLDIPKALLDAKLCAPLEETTAAPESKVGDEPIESAKTHLVDSMKTGQDTHWTTIHGIIKNEDFIKGREFAFYMIEHWAPVWWDRPEEDFKALAQILLTKTSAGCPSADVLKPCIARITVESELFPEKAKILIDALHTLLEYSPLNRKPPTPGKRRFVALKEQDLKAENLYESKWIQELMGPNEPFVIESIDASDPAPTDTPIVVIMRPFWNLWLEVLTQWKKAGSRFYILHLSDETNTDPLIPYGWDECLGVVRTYWREELEMYGDKVVVVPLGYHWSKGNPGVDLPEQRTPRLPFREYTWSFLGTDWNGRSEKMKNLTLIQPHKLQWFKEWNDPQMVKEEEYLNILLNTRFVPTPGGVNPETYRFYEALECGCIPLYIRQNGDELLVDKHYKKWLPLVNLPTWDHATAFMYELSNNITVLEEYRHNLLMGYAAWKKDLQTRVRKLFQIEQPGST